MSKIFDALQRSEADLSGMEPSALTEPTEVLLRIERRIAARERYNEAPSEEPAEALPEPEISEQFAVNTPPRPSAAAAGKPARVAANADPLGHIRAVPLSIPAGSKLVALADEQPAAAEAFRLLAVRLQELRRDRALKRLLITSSIPQEGKSMVAANLACTLAQGRQEKVLLLEGDVRRPSLAQRFGVDGHRGICEWLRKEASLLESIQFLPDAGIWAIWAGKSIGNPLDSLQPQKLSPLLDQLAEWFDWVIIDSPPVLPIADTSIWSALVEGIILVTRYGTTRKKELMRGIKAVDSEKLIGAVLNSSKYLTHSDYYYARTHSAR
jgi:capsular exopolysaccharide synthesis family protein